MNGISDIMWIASAVGSCSYAYCSFSHVLSTLHERILLPFAERQKQGKSAEKAIQAADYLVAGNPLTPRRELVILAGSEQLLVHARVAPNPNAPCDLFVSLEQDSNGEVTLRVAYDPKVSSISLEWPPS